MAPNDVPIGLTYALRPSVEICTRLVSLVARSEMNARASASVRLPTRNAGTSLVSASIASHVQVSPFEASSSSRTLRCFLPTKAQSSSSSRRSHGEPLQIRPLPRRHPAFPHGREVEVRRHLAFPRGREVEVRRWEWPDVNWPAGGLSPRLCSQSLTPKTRLEIETHRKVRKIEDSPS